MASEDHEVPRLAVVQVLRQQIQRGRPRRILLLLLLLWRGQPAERRGVEARVAEDLNRCLEEPRLAPEVAVQGALEGPRRKHHTAAVVAARGVCGVCLGVCFEIVFFLVCLLFHLLFQMAEAAKGGDGGKKNTPLLMRAIFIEPCFRVRFGEGVGGVGGLEELRPEHPKH